MEEKKHSENFIEDTLEKVLTTDGIDTNVKGFEELAVLLNLDDKSFSVLSPIVLAELEKSLQNPSVKIQLSQTLINENITINDFNILYQSMVEAIDTELEELTEIKRDFLKQFFGIIVNALNESDGVAEIINIPIELYHKDAKIPTYANIGDAGLDIYALDDCTIMPGETKLIPTGIKVAIPLGYELQVRPKSGRALKTKLRVANSPGTIDSGYRSEVGVIIENVEPPIRDISYHIENNKAVLDSVLYGKSYTIGKGEKFAQLVLNKVPTAQFYQINNISDVEGDRGGGFGSTGLK